METEIISAAGEASLSFTALFWRATLIVKLVIFILVIASFWSWAIYIQKIFLYRAAKKEIASFERSFWSGEPLDELFSRIGPTPNGGAKRIFVAGMLEWQRSHRPDGVLIPGITARMERAMDIAITREEENLTSGLSFLATVGSTAPFIGLFGTVWGIMNAFIEIAARQSSNLAVVAPGIAEALFATGLGLLAAIPAVIFYNRLSAQSGGILGSFDNFADEFSTLLSRQIES